jgi:hypothetical protein
MTHSRCFLLKLLGSVGLLISTSGCSLIFVKTAPSPGGPAVTRSSSCTSSPLAPIIDTAVGGFEVVRTVMAATADSAVYQDPKQPLSREADIGLGLGFTALFLGSAAYGFINTGQYASRQSGHEDDTPAEEGDATERWQRPPVRAPRPARPVAPAPAPPAETKAVEPIPTELEEDPSPTLETPPTSP